MNKIFAVIALIFVLGLIAAAQVPLKTGIEILKAEDARRYDDRLAELMRSPNAAVRARAALAAGRIGSQKAIPALTALFEDKNNAGAVLTAAVFALGEIEAAAGGDRILFVLQAESGSPKRDKELLSRAVEAAGKIVAANPKDENLSPLRSAIVHVLNDELGSGSPIREVVLSGLTATLRARPEGGTKTAAAFLTSDDARVRADALNTLARLGYKDALGDIRSMLRRDADPIVRANAATVLGRAKDTEALPLLIDAAMNGDDQRVRVAAVRALGSLGDPKAAAKLIERGQQLLLPMHGDPILKPGIKADKLKPVVVRLNKNELLEIATAVGRLLEGADNADAKTFLTRLAERTGYVDPETFIALARVSPEAMINFTLPADAAFQNFHAASAYGQGLGEIATTMDDMLIAQAGGKLVELTVGMATKVKAKDQDRMLRSIPDLIGAMAALKPDNLNEILLSLLKNSDPFVRAAAAGALTELPSSKANVEALNSAFAYALITDKHDNDAQLAILDALAKLDKNAGVGTFSIALSARDYLVRKKALEILDDKELIKRSPGIAMTLEVARDKHKDQVQPYLSAFGTRLGQVLNSDADYARALSRKNGSVKAVLTTEKGTFSIVFAAEEAPLTVDNFIKLARSGYFNGVRVHRVVPNFVMQDGDPRGDGNGGPGWSIRCEINMLPYDRGAVGMALSGKDTGGSQWFVTHTPQPHLDGGYTVFGHVSEADMKVVDNIARGDRIISVKIVGK
ncbi:MAG: peptidylprolyl isomerase [Acidobacteria bacterium]|nr:peptidylprolyl isomerase [Acidobacteriota bacterium]